MKNRYLEKIAYEMPLKELIKEHKDLVGVLKSNNRADELKELKEQGAELTKLEKLAALIKQAWDSDWDSDTHYGFAGNRSSLGNDLVWDNVYAHAKKPGVLVSVDGPDVPYTTNEDPVKFSQAMATIRKAIGPTKTLEQHKADHTMDWHRSYSWAAGIRKDHPPVKAMADGEIEGDGEYNYAASQIKI